MTIKHSYSTAIKILLVLVLLLPWDVFSEDIRSLNNSAKSSSKLNEKFEDGVEEDVLDLLSTSAFCLRNIQAKHTCFSHFCSVLESSAIADPTTSLSGWTMPLRI